MPSYPRHRLHLWLRWTTFALTLAGVLFLHFEIAQRALHSASKEPLSKLEERHLKLTEQTVIDLNPQFTQSISEPLKRMVPHRTDGMAQPLWPWVAAWMHTAADLPGSLHRAGVFRLGLVIGFLILLSVTCARSFTLPAALLVLMISGFHGFLPTLASYSGATLFHLFFLIGWIACVYGLQRNSLWVYGLIGAFSALAYLAEDRALPLALVFLFVSTARAIWGWLHMHWVKKESTSLWVWRNHLFGLILFGSMFGFIAGPRLVEAQAQFGHGLFSYVDQVRWLDDAPAAQAWVAKHPDAASLKAMPIQERLNAQIYLSGHTKLEIQARLLSGLNTLWLRYAQDGGWQLVVLILLLVAISSAVRWGTPKASHAGQRLHPETITTVLFILGASVATIGIAAWDSAVWETDHVRALLAPLALSLIWACESVLRRAKRRKASRIITVGYQLALWVMIGTDLVLHWQER
ncbi:MAG: hypothetical protein ABL974_06220 [Prosthecobacter sp.]